MTEKHKSDNEEDYMTEYWKVRATEYKAYTDEMKKILKDNTEEIRRLSQSIDEVVLPKIEKIDGIETQQAVTRTTVAKNNEDIRDHIKSHWQFWLAAAAPSIAGIAILLFGRR